MEHEIKIIMKYSDDNPINAANTLVYVDDEVIGCIQNIKLNVNAYNKIPELEVTFPNLRSIDIAPSYYGRKDFPDGHIETDLVATVDHNINRIKEVNGIRIVLGDIFKEGK